MSKLKTPTLTNRGGNIAEGETLIAKHEAGIKQSESLRKLFSGILASECWVSTWPASYPPDGTFPNTARFTIRDNKPGSEGYIDTNSVYNPDATGIAADKLSSTQRFTVELTKNLLDEKQKKMIEVNAYNINNPVMAVTILPTFIDKDGLLKYRTLTGQVFPSPFPGTQYIVAGRGKMGKQPIDNSNGKFKFLPDIFELFLSNQESLKVVQDILAGKGDLKPDTFFAALSFGSSKAYFDNSSQGNIDKIEQFLDNPGNPFSNKVNFVVSGLKK